MMAIFFLRHIKTFNNTQKIISGRADISTIPNQVLQIPDDCNEFDIVYSSPSMRCRDTIELIPSQMINGNVKYVDSLLERDVGVLENLSKREAIKQYPHLFINQRIGVDVLIPGGESIDDIVRRVNPLVDYVIHCTRNQNYLFCSHNQTLKVIYALLKKVPITNQYWQQVDFKQGVVIKVE